LPPQIRGKPCLRSGSAECNPAAYRKDVASSAGHLAQFSDRFGEVVLLGSVARRAAVGVAEERLIA
jgi:hypothetical protein